MTMKQFLQVNRETIDQGVKNAYDITLTNDSERVEWINNEESLYNWARSERVRI